MAFPYPSRRAQTAKTNEAPTRAFGRVQILGSKFWSTWQAPLNARTRLSVSKHRGAISEPATRYEIQLLACREEKRIE